MGINLKLSSSASGTRNVGFGGGANLRASNLFTADDMHIDGIYWCRPYDMENDFGSEGAALAAAAGHRYVFFISSDHWNSVYGWTRGNGLWMAWGDDPGAYPPANAFTQVVAGTVVADTFTFEQLETPFLVYNPDDLPDHPFHLYAHGSNSSGEGQTTVVFRSSDLVTWTVEGRSHISSYFGGHAGYQQVFRLGVNDWVSYGLGFLLNTDGNKVAQWTSTDGLDFTVSIGNLDIVVDKSRFGINDGIHCTIGAQDYAICLEDNYDIALNANPTATPGAVRLGQYVSMVPIDANWNVDTNDLNDVVRISSRYAGTYPGPTYLQSVSGFLEDGIAHIWATHGFFSDIGLVAGASYTNGGGYDDELVDYYTYVVDATAAASAAPCGVRASCQSAVVALQWYDALPHQNYRIYRGTSAGTQATLIGDVAGLSATDSPAPGSVYYYKVVTLNGGEQGSRVVSTYVS
jgi:hypothetical protein